MKSKWQSIVEPVFGTLTQFMGLRKINTIGIQQANKVMYLSAIAYNLKKYLNFTEKQAQSEAKSQSQHKKDILAYTVNITLKLSHLINLNPNYLQKDNLV